MTDDPKPDDLAAVLYHALNGLGVADPAQRAEHFMRQWLDGRPHGREQVKAGLAAHFAVGSDALERLTKELANAERARDEAVAEVARLAALEREYSEAWDQHRDDMDVVMNAAAKETKRADEAVAERDRLRAIAQAAAAYREAESDATPRMWRGKALQDLANALDDALALPVAPVSDAAAEPKRSETP